MTALAGVGAPTEIVVLLISIGVFAIVVWSIKEYWLPESDWEDTKSCVKLGLHLSEIRSYLQELAMLGTMPTQYESIASELKQNQITLIRETVEYVEDMITQLEAESHNAYGDCLKDLKGSEDSVQTLLAKAKLAINGCGSSEQER